MNRLNNGMRPFGFTIFGQPATKKNSATMLRNHACLLPSKAYRRYEKHCREAINMLRYKMKLPHFLWPVRLQVHYFLESEAHYPDVVGLMQATADIISDEYKTIEHKRRLVCPWLLADDRIIKNWDGTRVSVDRKNPRVEIIIIPLPLDLKAETDPYIRRAVEEKNQGKLFLEEGKENEQYSKKAAAGHEKGLVQRG